MTLLLKLSSFLFYYNFFLGCYFCVLVIIVIFVLNTIIHKLCISKHAQRTEIKRLKLLLILKKTQHQQQIWTHTHTLTHNITLQKSKIFTHYILEHKRTNSYTHFIHLNTHIHIHIYEYMYVIIYAAKIHMFIYTYT